MKNMGSFMCFMVMTERMLKDGSMTYDIIKNLVEQLSCDFVLADPKEPEKISDEDMEILIDFVSEAFQQGYHQ